MYSEKTKAEDSSLKNQLEAESSRNQNKNTSESTQNAAHDAEKENVNNCGGPAPVAATEDSHDVEKGVLERNVTRETHTSTVSVHNDEKNDFPEGGLKAWSVVLGAFCGSFSVFGIINATGVLMDHFKEYQLKDYNEAQIGWIFGLALFLTFFCGAPIGPIFDARGPRFLILCGSVLLVLSMFLLGECTKYWHFFMVYSVLNGIGGALINTPCIASIGHFFLKRRANATGVAMTAGGIGGIIFPLMLQKLFPMVGFAWSARIMGFMLLFLLVICNTLVRSRLPRKPLPSFGSILPDFTVFKDIPFSLLTFGILLLEWGIFVPLTFITSYSNSKGFPYEFGFQALAIMNAGSVVGRVFAGIVADMIGRVNTLILSIGMCIVTCLALWLPAQDSKAMIIVFSVTFGFVSGSNLSLSPVCIGQMCKTENYGKYFATCWMAVSLGTLTALPVAGQILTNSGGDFTGVIIFAGLAYFAAMVCLIAARILKVGWKWNVVY